MKRWKAMGTGLVGIAAWGLSSCSPSAFESETVIDGVRILASRASQPRTTPGATVSLEVLAYDGRDPGAAKTQKMQLFWLNLLCVNPKDDAYYACFSQFAKGGTQGRPLFCVDDGGGTRCAAETNDSGLDGGPPSVEASAGDAAPPNDAAVNDGEGTTDGTVHDAGVDFSRLLVGHFTFPMPPDVIIPRNGSSPYGLVIVFNVACAGHLELVPFDPNNQDPQQVPIGCFDSQHNQLGANDFVFGFTRVYAEKMPNEENPRITGVDTAAGPLDVEGGVTTASFKATACPGDADTCDHHAIGPVIDPSTLGNKQVWADFFATAGTFKSSARLLHDPMATLSIPSGTDDEYISPNSATGTQNFIWIVVHDDQGGADWVTVPLALK